MSSQAFRGRRIAAVTCALASTALTGGCGFLGAAGSTPAASDAPVMSPSAAAPAAPTPRVASADLTSSLDGRAASLDVSVDPLTTGLPEVWSTDVSLAADCGLAPDATEYAAVTVVFTAHGLPTKKTPTSSNLRLDLTLAGGDRIGLVVDDDNDPTDFCVDGSALPTATTLQTQNLADDYQTMTVYLVAPAGPAGPASLRDAVLQARGLQHQPDSLDSRDWSWDVGRVTAGDACPDDPNSLCVALG